MFINIRYKVCLKPLSQYLCFVAAAAAGHRRFVGRLAIVFQRLRRWVKRMLLLDFELQAPPASDTESIALVPSATPSARLRVITRHGSAGCRALHTRVGACLRNTARAAPADAHLRGTVDALIKSV